MEELNINIPEFIFKICDRSNCIEIDLDLANKSSEEITELINNKIINSVKNRNGNYILFQLYNNLYEVASIDRLIQRHLQVTIPIKNNIILSIMLKYAVLSIKRAKQIIQYEIGNEGNKQSLIDHNLIILDKLSLYEDYFKQKFFSYLDKNQLIIKPDEFNNCTFKWIGDKPEIESLYNYLIKKGYLKTNRTKLEIFQQLFDNQGIERFVDRKIIWQDRGTNGSVRIYSIRLLVETLLEQGLIDNMHYNSKDFIRVVKNTFVDANQDPIGELKKATSNPAIEIRKEFRSFISNL